MQVIIKIISEVEYNQFRLDNKTIVETHHPYDNLISINVEQRKKYILSYFLRGSIGKRYSIEILSPIHLGPRRKKMVYNETFGFMEIDLTNL